MSQLHYIPPPTQADYELLGMTADTDMLDAIKQYRKLALIYHPDRNFGDKGAEANFKAIAAAWERIEPVLKSSVPFPKVNLTDPNLNLEDVIVDWLLAMDSAQPQSAPPPPPPPAPSRHVDSSGKWGLLGTEIAIYTGQPASSRAPHHQPGNWTRQRVRRQTDSGISIHKIFPEEAKKLMEEYPNAFAALKALQRRYPQFALFEAVACKASTHRGLAVIGQAAATSEEQLDALYDPMASIKAAKDNLPLIAGEVTFGGKRVSSNMIAFALAFLEDYIREKLVPKIRKRPEPETDFPEMGGGRTALR